MNLNQPMRNFLRSEAESMGRKSPLARRLLAGGLPTIRRCRECGCTDFNACRTDTGPCWWVEADLCSACATATPLPASRGGAGGGV